MPVYTNLREQNIRDQLYMRREPGTIIANTRQAPLSAKLQ